MESLPPTSTPLTGDAQPIPAATPKGVLLGELRAALGHLDQASMILHYQMEGSWSPDLRAAISSIVRFERDLSSGRVE